MTNERIQILTAALAASGPLLLLAFGLIPASFLNRRGLGAARTGAAFSAAAFVLAIGAAVSLMFSGPSDVRRHITGLFEVSVYFDNLSSIVLALVAFLLAVVTRYSTNCLAGDPAQGRFTKWLCLTGGSALAIVISGNLVQFALAWTATSLSLHQLLVFYPERPGALLAARKKFIISRLGDACLLAVIVLVYAEFGTWNFAELFTILKRMHETGLDAGTFAISAICFLVVVCAMLKSAQFPFHSWLPDTMETPTPVSALMHAGIINAGGFLIIRLNTLVTLSPGALSTLALFGAFTALFASLVMLTHASVKRSLAFSTVAQMGFMMLECGLGAFSLAVLHLVAHSLYKAHAFLSSGNMVDLAKASWAPTVKPKSQPLTLLAAFAASLVLVLGAVWLMGVDGQHEPGLLVLGSIFTMALAYALWNLWSQSFSLKLAAFGAVFGGGLVVAFFGMHQGFTHLLGRNVWTNSVLDSWLGILVAVTLLTLFLAVLVVQTEMPQWVGRPWFQAIYVHARNGFYFNTLANRCVAAVWPIKSHSVKS